MCTIFNLNILIINIKNYIQAEFYVLCDNENGKLFLGKSKLLIFMYNILNQFSKVMINHCFQNY